MVLLAACRINPVDSPRRGSPLRRGSPSTGPEASTGPSDGLQPGKLSCFTPIPAEAQEVHLGPRVFRVVGSVGRLTTGTPHATFLTTGLLL